MSNLVQHLNVALLKLLSVNFHIDLEAPDRWWWWWIFIFG